jgi:hypothetical protein
MRKHILNAIQAHAAAEYTRKTKRNPHAASRPPMRRFFFAWRKVWAQHR